MSFRCIGQSEIAGKLEQCKNESDTPSDPFRPQWGWICSECANAPKNRARVAGTVPLVVETPDLDKPNLLNETMGAGEGYDGRQR